MLGNRLGWAIAVVLAVGFGLAFRELAAVNRLTAPTSLITQAAANEALSIEISPTAIVRLDAAGDARELYQKAIDDIRRDSARYAEAEASVDPGVFEQTPACVALVAAAHCPGDVLADPPARVGYAPPGDDFDAIQQAARCLGRAAVLRMAKDAARAKPLFEAQFALGAKLFAGRVRYYEADTGLAVAREAVGGLRALATQAGDARQDANLSTFDRAAAGLQGGRLSPVWNAIGALDGDVIAEHAGDVYALTDRASRERMWRVEAILSLGRHRFNVERPADRLAVPRRLAELEAGENDPVILAAIRAAKNLTIEEFRTLR